MTLSVLVAYIKTLIFLSGKMFLVSFWLKTLIVIYTWI